MLNEPASTRDDRPAVRPTAATRTNNLHDQLRESVATVLMIDRETFVSSDQESGGRALPEALLMTSRLVATFEGHLLLDAQAAYDELDKLLAPLHHLAVFREGQPANSAGPASPHVVHILTGQIATPQPRAWWPNALLFAATVFSVLMVGTFLEIDRIATVNIFAARALAGRWVYELPRGLPYAFSILLILGAHELGHYFAARRHKLAVTLPYFIPVPPIPELGGTFGTMGAFIQLRQPMRNRKMLFDVGAAGPLCGLLFAIPILFIGLRSAQTTGLPLSGVYSYEGDSVVYAIAKIVTFGHFLPDGKEDVWITSSQLAWAGWTGLLVTALNLIPIGQLDGGHVLYALIGERARRLYFPILGIMLVLTLFTYIWLLWVVLLLLFGRVYATPLNMITPLDKRRRYLAIFTIIVFILVFVPAPLTVRTVGSNSILPSLGDSASLLPLIPTALVGVWRRFRC
jgi:membrane-associated protease RseP (regulator of RpoE activity)